MSDRLGAGSQRSKLVVFETPDAEASPSRETLPPDAIRAELEKVVASPQFTRSERLSRFLRFIVEQGLAGRSDRLKEYSLAIEIYKRPSTFDPQVDSIVRAEAARLRSKLDEYYLASGLNDNVLIAVPKGGYAPVFTARDGALAALAVRRSWIRSPRGLAAVALLALVAGIGAYWAAVGLLKRPASPAEARFDRPGTAFNARHSTSLAVLPLAHLCPDKEHEFFSDGLTEELIEALAHVPGLQVVSRTSSFYYKGKADDIRKIGRQLDVDAVLEGSVRTTGNKLRISVQLINVADGYHLWSQTYDRGVSDALAVQREIAVGVANALRLQLAGGSWGWSLDRVPAKIEAYNLFLKGRYFARKWTGEGLQQAIGYYEQAIRLDPNFSRAHAELAETYCVAGIHAGLAPDEAMPKAKSAALRALEIDDALGHAHSALGLVRAVYEWDWKGAGLEFERAHGLDPGDADIHEAWVMGYLAPTGRLDEAIKQSLEAQVLDPVSPRIASVLGMVHYFARRNDQAIEQLRKALELDPNFYSAYLALAAAYGQNSQYDQAIAAVQKGRAAWQSGISRSFLAHTYALMGKASQAEALLSELTALSRSRYVPSAHIAAVYAALGQTDRALDWLEKAYSQRSASLAFLKVNPRYDSLRQQPRFRAMLKKINLQ